MRGTQLFSYARQQFTRPKPIALLGACFFVTGLAVSVRPVAPLFAAEPEVSYSRDVRPILADKCFHCHGPDGSTRKADLRLDTADGMFHGKSTVVVPGKVDESSLVQRILSKDESEMMPPPESTKTLSDAQKEILRRWVDQGAKYQQHWAFEAIQRPELPPAIQSPHPVDRFLDKRLQKSGLTAQPQADRETLIRRVAITLTGLPPTLREVDEYLADTSTDAYEKMVDRYLASSRYGEEMAKHWLDVARYADTHGLHLDNERQMWAYRDWVVRAFNENLPYDQFTIWQVAGDLLPNPSRDQLIATGFNRCNVTTSEGGAIPEEFLYRYAVERTTAVSQAWLGLTAGCAVCHDHKYDPLTAKEFYSLYAFFNSAADPAMDGNTNVTAPFMKLPREKELATAAAAAKVQDEARAWIDIVLSHTNYVDPADAKTEIARKTVRDVLLDDVTPFGAYSRSSSRNPIDWLTDPEIKAPMGRRIIRQAFASTYTDDFEYKLHPFLVPQEGQFEVSVYVDEVDLPSSIGFGIAGAKTLNWKKTDAGLVRDGATESEIRPGQWNRLTINAAELGLNPGQRIHGLKLSQTGGIAYWDAVLMKGQADPATDPLESMTAWRKAIGTTVPPELPGELHPLIQAGPDKVLTEDEASKLRRFYLAVVARPVNEEVAAARTTWLTARIARTVADDSPPGTFIFRDTPAPRESFVMLRGQYDTKGDPVEPAVPAVLPAIKKSSPETRLNRLDLARWLVTPENPLPARVTVNRFWQQVFGTGIVKTSFDFGMQGEVPSHPELLDWLSAEFRESGWNTKQLMKLLLTSDAFRRHSRLLPEVRVADPENRLYARGPRIRLDAEQVRDNALFTSGLIDLTMGGRGVKPYQPANIWEPVGYSDSNTRFYMQDHGSSLYRRSLYVFLKRTAPPPFMSNFDAPNREQVCTVRERSNTPLQALQLMNDVQHFEAARALAERVFVEGGESTESRLRYLYKTVLSRQPAPEELTLLVASLNRQTELFASNPESAHQAIHVGESKPRGVASDVETAAWTMLANLVLNTDEALNRN
ncbi:PSD1 and planctomycete cytochrome C domain-containing protein [Schlesneria sp. T3-172]|uniref:PSD1 and planctomycete cytochrome C domain-containing protein n=1 Tax=Schlesneria sphaerica TaxID=3373610 RepID=UPI0037CC2F8B